MRIVDVNSTESYHRQKKQDSVYELPFEIRAASALGISVVADALDYIGAPIFALPIIGDMADAIVASLLYYITKSKVNVVINAVEFIPFVGDFIPTYTISTLLWILNESRKRNNHNQRTDNRKDKTSARILKSSNVDIMGQSQYEDLRTRIMRTIAILRSKTK
jgi:hypothetical protein